MSEEEKKFTASGIPIKKFYTPGDIAGLNYDRDSGIPGAAPYTRGAYPNMYRGRLWRIKQLSGLDTAVESCERIKSLVEAGEEGITINTVGTGFNCYDLDHPEILARWDELGSQGAVIMSLHDWEAYLEGIPIERLYVGIIDQPMAFTFSFPGFLAVAEKRGIPWSELSGTGMNEMILAYLACPIKEPIPPEHCLRLLGDEVEFCIKNVPKFMPVSYCGNDCRETGCNAYQELAIVFAHAIALADEVLKRGGLKFDDFGYMISAITCNGDMDFFEEIAKFRAARRMWYKIAKERYHAQDPRSLRCRIHVETAGAPLTYQQPLNNVVRVAYQTLACALGGVQSISTDSYDEPVCIPSEEAALLAIRTQQIAQHEIGVTNVADPLAVSYYVEWLTKEIEERAWDFLNKIEELGGFVGAINSGWLHRQIANEMYNHERKVMSGEKKVVGVNCFQMAHEPFRIPTFRTSPDTPDKVLAELEKLRWERDNTKVRQALDNLKETYLSDGNFIPAAIEAIKAYATIGEMGGVLRDAFSIWRSPIGMI